MINKYDACIFIFLKIFNIMKSFSNSTFSKITWNFMLPFGALLYGSHGVLLNICKVDGKIPFNSAAVVLLIELTKLLLSIMMLLAELRTKGKQILVMPNLKQFIAFSVPAILYTINNNLVVHVQAYIDPASFQVLSNLKIVSTVILYKIILKRSISTNKWIAFILITVAGASNSYGGWVSNPVHHSEMKVHVTFTGILLILALCCISGVAGVYTEYILKKQAQLPFAVQSIMLYVFGVGINFFAFLTLQFLSMSDDEIGLKDSGDMFVGFSVWTVVIIASQALSGILNGVIMKQGNNLTRLIMIAGAMLVSTTLSVFIFSLQFNDYFIYAFVLVVLAMAIYYRPDR